MFPFMFLCDTYLPLPTVSLFSYFRKSAVLSLFSSSEMCSEVQSSYVSCLLLVHICMRLHTRLMYVNIIQPLSCKIKNPNTWMRSQLREDQGGTWFSCWRTLSAASRQIKVVKLSEGSCWSSFCISIIHFSAQLFAGALAVKRKVKEDEYAYLASWAGWL